MALIITNQKHARDATKGPGFARTHAVTYKLDSPFGGERLRAIIINTRVEADRFLRPQSEVTARRVSTTSGGEGT